MAKDAIVLLREDHQAVERLFKRFEKAGETAHKTKGSLVERMIEELSRHAAIEEQIFYPAARQSLEDDDPVLEALEEHHIVKWTLSELDGMRPEEERFGAKVAVMMEMVRHHVQEEEEELFPKMRDALGRSRLREIGEAMEAAKKMAPTKPHPRLPDEPPANVVAGLAAAAGDRVINLTKDAARKLTRH